MTASMKSHSPDPEPIGLAAGRVEGSSMPGPEQKVLNAFIGRWVTEGHTFASAGAPARKILSSDVYEWAPGGFFVVHCAYGRIGDVGVGGIEIIGYDASSKKYRSQFFDNNGNMSTQQLVARASTWTWTAEKTRCTSVTSHDGKTMTARHERTDDGVRWVPSMDVTLTRVE